MSRVTLHPSGQVLIVEAHETILDAALRVGLNLPHSCKGGHCSSCRARILQGKVLYPMGRPLGLMEQEEREGYTLLCQAHAASEEMAIQVREMRRALDTQIHSLPCRVERLTPLAADVMAVFLRLPATEEFTFIAGQYLDVMLSQNRRRSFSIANAPGEGKLLELHVRRVANGEFTEQLFAGMKEKTLLRIEGPLGQFCFQSESPRAALMIGGGTGYAPLRAMLRERLAQGDQRTLHLYWGAQKRADLYEHDILLRMCEQHANVSYTPVLSSPTLGDDWTGRVGWVHAAAAADHPNLTDFDVYASGPPAMVEAVRHEFIERGLKPEQLFFDSFDYAPDTLEKLRQAAGVDAAERGDA